VDKRNTNTFTYAYGLFSRSQEDPVIGQYNQNIILLDTLSYFDIEKGYLIFKLLM